MLSANGYAKGWLLDMGPPHLTNESLGIWRGYWHPGGLSGESWFGRGDDGIQIVAMISNLLRRSFEAVSLTYRIHNGLQNGWPEHDLFES